MTDWRASFAESRRPSAIQDLANSQGKLLRKEDFVPAQLTMIQLSDFGSAHVIDGATARRITGGDEAMHPFYTSPELTLDYGEDNWEVPGLRVSHKTNVWNIGLIICCLIRMEEDLP
ncbi:hypothetical protein E4T39_01579 [Aureobasidium subglaciale]|nr:hypothetical protein E4T39_01579 [Aureobasidium subglaciale]